MQQELSSVLQLATAAQSACIIHRTNGLLCLRRDASISIQIHICLASALMQKKDLFEGPCDWHVPTVPEILWTFNGDYVEG